MSRIKPLPESINGFKILDDFGTIKRNVGNKKDRYCLALCKRCGKKIRIRPYDLSRQESCGCIFIYPHLKNFTRLRSIFNGMKSRCNNKNDDGYNSYGARGIKVCKEWLDNTNSFLQWSIDNGYTDNLTIDRINNDGDYRPENCRWVSMDIQIQNSSRTVLNASLVLELRANHHSLNFNELSKKYNIPRETIRNAVKKQTWKNI